MKNSPAWGEGVSGIFELDDHLKTGLDFKFQILFWRQSYIYQLKYGPD
jgi:hypothetical protein